MQKAREELKEEYSETTKQPSADDIKERAGQNFIENETKVALEQGLKNANAFIETAGLKGAVTIEPYNTKEGTEAALREAFPDIDGKTDPELTFAIEQLNEGVFNGVEKNGTIIVDTQSAIKNKKGGVYVHELLHAVLNNKFKNDGAQSKVGKEFLEGLKESNPAIYDSYRSYKTL